MSARPEPSSSSRPRKPMSLRTREALWAYAFLLIPFSLFLLIRIYPAFQAFYLSLHEWSADPSDRPFVGGENYSRLVSDARLGRALLNTGLYTLLGVPVQLALGLIAALLLQSIPRFRAFFRALYFAPYVVPAVAIGWVFSWMLSANFGVVNTLLDAVGIPPQPFLRSPAQALPTVTAVVIWQHLGFQIVLFLAGLESIPRTYIEAARIDGAGRWQMFRYIILPLLNGVIVFSAVIFTIRYLQLFTLVVNLNFTDQGGPIGSTLSVALYVYQLAFNRFQFGYAAAVTVVLFVIVLIVTLVQLRLISRRVEY